MEKKNKIIELKERLNKLISYWNIRKESAVSANQQLYTKLNSLKEMEMMERLPPQYLKAYLTFKQAVYSNFQEEHLSQANFDKDSYLNRLEKEIEMSEKTAGFVVDNEIVLPKDYSLCVLSETDIRNILEQKEKLLELAKVQAEKMWEENRLDEVFGLDEKTYIDLMTKEVYEKLVRKYFVIT